MLNARLQHAARGSLTVVVLLCCTCLTHGDAPDTPQDPKNQDSYRLRYARTYLKFTEVNLQRAEAMNQQIPRIVPESKLEAMRGEIKIAKKLLETAELENEASSAQDFLVYLRLAETMHQLALDEWRRVEAIHQANPQNKSAWDVESLRLRAKLAELNLERGRALVDGSFEQQTKWKLGLLFGEVIRLREQVIRLQK